MLLLLLLNNLVAVSVVVRPTLLVGFENDNDNDDAVDAIIAVIVRVLNRNTVVEQHRNCMSRLAFSLSLFLDLNWDVL